MEYFLHPGHSGSHVKYYGSLNPAEQLVHYHRTLGDFIIIGGCIFFVAVCFMFIYWGLFGRLPFTKNE